MMKVTNGTEQIIIHDEAIEEPEIEQKDELAMGLKVPSSVKTPTNYLHGLRQYNDIYNDIKTQMDVAWRLYRFNSVIGNAVDVLVDFAVTSVTPEETGNKKLDIIVRHFFDNVNYDNTNCVPGVYSIMQEFALEWFTSGNAFPYVKWDNVEVDGIEGEWSLPVSITLLNPQSIELPKEPIAFGQEVIYLRLDDALWGKLKLDGRSDPEAALLKQAIPRSVMNSIRNSRSSFSAGIRLNPKFVSHLKRKAKSYQVWGVPYLSRCFASASLIERLKELDESISAGLINLITIFKIGTEEHPASSARLRKFASLIRNPKATTTLVWAHDIEVMQTGPDGKILAFKDKYKDSKEDLLIGLGIPPVLMSLNQQGNEWVSILSLVEKLSNWRTITSIYLEKICNQISKANDFNEKVKVKWDRMSLKDEASVKNLILAFYDRGLISVGTALQQGGYNFDGELTKKEKEKDQTELFLPPQLPFSSKQETSQSKPNESDVKSIKSNIKKSVKIDTINTVDMKKMKIIEPKVKESNIK